MTFRVGQKVVCINADPDMYGNKTGLAEGAIYTVSSLVYDRLWDMHGVTLHEVKIPRCRHEKIGWNNLRFRPAVERKTDISIFTAMLKINSRELVTD